MKYERHIMPLKKKGMSGLWLELYVVTIDMIIHDNIKQISANNLFFYVYNKGLPLPKRVNKLCWFTYVCTNYDWNKPHHVMSIVMHVHIDFNVYI